MAQLRRCRSLHRGMQVSTLAHQLAVTEELVVIDLPLTGDVSKFPTVLRSSHINHLACVT